MQYCCWSSVRIVGKMKNVLLQHLLKKRCLWTEWTSSVVLLLGVCGKLEDFWCSSNTILSLNAISIVPLSRKKTYHIWIDTGINVLVIPHIHMTFLRGYNCFINHFHEKLCYRYNFIDLPATQSNYWPFLSRPPFSEGRGQVLQCNFEKNCRKHWN